MLWLQPSLLGTGPAGVIVSPTLHKMNGMFMLALSHATQEAGRVVLTGAHSLVPCV